MTKREQIVEILQKHIYYSKGDVTLNSPLVDIADAILALEPEQSENKSAEEILARVIDVDIEIIRANPDGIWGTTFKEALQAMEEYRQQPKEEYRNGSVYCGVCGSKLRKDEPAD